jgi:RimJ/RimL family protein N-acetyltransferase
MCHYAFATWNLQRIYARPFGRNGASQRVLEKAGFTLEYTLKDNLFKEGRLEDEFCYGLRNPNFKV